MGNQWSNEERTLRELEQRSGCNFPGCHYRPSNRKNWMSSLNPERLKVNQIVWPGTHNSATNLDLAHLLIPAYPLIFYLFAQCQSESIYNQLVLGTRLLDIRVNKDRLICHGVLISYVIDVVISDIKRFLSETESEIIILEIRTEFGHNDPPGFETYLEQQLGEYLIPQNNQVFHKAVAEILPKRIICIWKPRNSDPPRPGGLLWSSGYLQDNWIDTNVPTTKFEGNLNNLSRQPPVSSRNYFYRVENTLTPQAAAIDWFVKPITHRIHGFRRLFLAQCVLRNIIDRLQVFSTDFIDEDFVDACVGLTWARIEGHA
ncbi:hypothetical protein QVD17_04588 [Tagetes erecta]|uniref:Phosphatidylinositol-specific phospholipase C X domain-containing protein n=1 Tax=Tagetes erecta TaxID=13708 RepID=A0AAD8LCZ6_TARER|nr:hypothetical protein QVD17_04588 [Tagetes erecta]